MNTETVLMTGKYKNNQTLNKTLQIPDAEALEVMIKGRTEKGHDFVTIADSNSKKIGRYSGIIDEKLAVLDSSIKVTFKSDGATVDDGVTIKVFAITAFKGIKLQLLEITENILKRGTKQVYSKIVTSLNKLKELHAQVIQTQEIENIVEKVNSELTGIAQIYEEIAGMNSVIMAAHSQQFESITHLKTETLGNIKRINEQRQKYTALQEKNQEKLATIDDSLEKQKLQFSIEAHKNTLQAIQMQQIVWNEFYRVQESLEAKLKAHSKKIGLLLYFLQVNAQLYEQAVNLASLRKTDVAALINLTDLNELQKIVTDIQTSEDELKKLKDKIQQTDFK